MQTLRQLSLTLALRPVYPEGIPVEVCELFEKLALDVRCRGWEHYSSDALLHRIRWEMQIERGNREYKINDHFSSILARWFLDRHPDMDGFFELRALRSKVRECV
jgi:hypothetical protein